MTDQRGPAGAGSGQAGAGGRAPVGMVGTDPDHTEIAC
jgi:hypothetical protein